MRKTFKMDYGNGTELEEFDVDYMVLFGAYDNEHPELHYNNRRSKITCWTNNTMIIKLIIIISRKGCFQN